MSSETPGLRRELGLVDAISIVVGIVIGGGIFVVPNLVARSLPSAPVMLTCWIVAGIVSFFGALACAELGGAFPETGGQYVYLREAFGPLAGFLCGWSMFTVSRSAQLAWLAVTFVAYGSYFVAVPPLTARLLALGLLTLFAGINYLGVSSGALVQKALTALKILGILVIVGAAALAPPHGPALAAAPAPFSLAQFGVAMIACLLAYDGWIQVSFVAGEIRNPRRNVFASLAIGVAVCTSVYLLANLAYLRVLTIPQIAGSAHVGATAAETAMGPSGGKLVSVIILLSILGALNGCFLTIPRVYVAQAQDGLFPHWFARIDPRRGTPAFSIWAQALWSAALVLTGSYETLIDYAMFGIWLFYGFMVLGLYRLRSTRPDLPRPYRMWGYPVTPALFLGVTAWFLGNTLITRPGPALAGLALIAAGVPVYAVMLRREKKTALEVTS